MRTLAEADVEDLATGAAILGTGGGGDPYIGKLLAQAAIREHGPVTIVSIDEVPDDALVVPSAMMGAPTVVVEKLPNGEEIGRAFQALQDHLGRRVTHTVSIEAGGVNSVIPFIVAARMGLPIVDADGMGRAFPELQMLMPTLFDIPSTPMAVADEKGNTVVICAIDNRWSERLARSITIDMGASASIALYPMSGRQTKASMVGGTITLAHDLGRLIREARAVHADPIDAVIARLNAHRIFQGKITEVVRRTETGFARGEARLQGSDAYAGSSLLLRFQNENLVAVRDGDVVASVPDLIIVVSSDGGQPITTEELRYGFRVTVLAAPCDPRWRTPRGLELVGPRYFGYDFDYVPVEVRSACAV